MIALVATLTINSLYSIRIPYTWQHAITYPVLPPSAVLGLAANALQRYKDCKHPLEYLSLIEDTVVWAGSRLLSPCVIKNQNVSTLLVFEGPIFETKFTDVYGREFAYARNLEIALIFKDKSIAEDAAKALRYVPVTCGDSESSATITHVKIHDVMTAGVAETCKTPYPVPFRDSVILKGGKGTIYYMHERCFNKGEKMPLRSYIVPIAERNNGVIIPTILEIQDSQSITLDIDGQFNILVDKDSLP